MLPRALLDTDTLSAVMKQQPAAVARATVYLADHGQLTFSIITRYEILRGLAAKRAVAQLAAFERLCSISTVLPLADAAIVQAADIYADLHQRGMPLGDADILIAATALVNDLVVVTNNENHFGRIVGLAVDNWLK